MIVVKRHHKAIHLYNESGNRLPVQHDTVETVFHKLIDAFHIPAYEINCIFVHEEALREMKIQYFDEDVYTDIISFTLDCSENFLKVSCIFLLHEFGKMQPNIMSRLNKNLFVFSFMVFFI